MNSLSRCLCSVTLFLFLADIAPLAAQPLEKVILTATNSEDMNQALFRYGIEKGLFRKEGIDLEYRFLPPNLAVAALLAKEVDYVSQLGTLSQAAVRGLAVRVIAVGYDKPFFYILVQPNIKSAKDLIGKKFAVSSLRGTAARTARAALTALGLNPDRELTFIVVGQSSTRMLAMETKSVEATIFPPPWNFRLRQKGFKQLGFAGEHVTEPFVGIGTSVERIQNNPTQVKKVLRAFVLSMKAIKTEQKEAAGFIAHSYKLEPDIAAEMYETTFRTLTKDGTLDQGVLRDFVKAVKEEVGVAKNVAVAEVVDFSLLSEALKETGS